MTRYEFTERLRNTLVGEVPATVVEENVRFYDRYISDEMAKGKSEEEVLAGLGDARLIAKTILETWQSNDIDSGYYGSAAGHDQDDYRTTQIYETIYEENDNRNSQQGGGSFFGMNGKIYRLDKWYLKLIPIAIILLIFGLVFMMFFGMMKLSIMVLTSPIFWGFIVVTTILRIFFRRR